MAGKEQEGLQEIVGMARSLISFISSVQSPSRVIATPDRSSEVPALHQDAANGGPTPGRSSVLSGVPDTSRSGYQHGGPTPGRSSVLSGVPDTSRSGYQHGGPTPGRSSVLSGVQDTSRSGYQHGGPTPGRSSVLSGVPDTSRSGYQHGSPTPGRSTDVSGVQATYRSGYQHGGPTPGRSTVLSGVPETYRSGYQHGGSTPAPSASEGRASSGDRLQSEMQRSFPGFFNRSKKRTVTSALPKIKQANPVRLIRLQFFLLPGPTDRTPKASSEIGLLEAGLGRRTVAFPENAGHSEIEKTLEDHFPKLMGITGGWLCYKASGGAGQRKLSVIPTEFEGYTAQLLKSVSTNGRNMIYIIPLQEEIDTTPLPYDALEFDRMPKSMCKTCGIVMPVQFLALHIGTCVAVEKDNNSELDFSFAEPFDVQPEDSLMVKCPICDVEFDSEEISVHASSCSDGTFGDIQPMCTNAGTDIVAGTSGIPRQQVPEIEDWKTEADPMKAASLYRRSILTNSENKPDVVVWLDLTDSEEEREMAVLSFYKRQGVDWASPFIVKLKGDPAIGEGVARYFFSFIMEKLQCGLHLTHDNPVKTLLFDGEEDHKVPSTTLALLHGDLFRVVGRMIGHSFIHGGPLYTGLSPCFFPMLSGHTDDIPVINIRDCPDTDVAEVVSLLDGNKVLTPHDREEINALAYSWDLPPVSDGNRRCLLETILHHGVIGRREKQAKQLKRGLQDTGVLPMLTERPDLVEVLFPRSAASVVDPEMIFKRVIWPGEEVEEEEMEDSSRVTAYLREFIQNGSSETLKDLVVFWTGWSVLTDHLHVEVSAAPLPTASTCMSTIKIPLSIKSYDTFKEMMEGALKSSHYGFGLI